jgi:hypothetical protein
LKGTSNPIKIGPEFTMIAKEVKSEKKKVVITVKQTYGKYCPNLWIGMYAVGDLNLYVM